MNVAEEHHLLHLRDPIKRLRLQVLIDHLLRFLRANTLAVDGSFLNLQLVGSLGETKIEVVENYFFKLLQVEWE